MRRLGFQVTLLNHLGLEHPLLIGQFGELEEGEQRFQLACIVLSVGPRKSNCRGMFASERLHGRSMNGIEGDLGE